MKPLTPKQSNILAFVTCFINNNKYSPTIKEIAYHFNYKSENAAQCHINALIQKGAITSTPNTSRSIVVISGNDLDKFTNIQLLKELIKRNQDKCIDKSGWCEYSIPISAMLDANIKFTIGANDILTGE